MAYKFKPNNTQKALYIKKLAELDNWIKGAGVEYHAEKALTGTVYFTISGKRYRVGSHKPGVNYAGEINFYAAPINAPAIAALILSGKQLNSRGAVVK